MRLGLGTLIGSDADPTKNDYEFQFLTGQGLPFALRNEEKTETEENVAWSSSDTSDASKRMGSLEIPVWDKEKHCFISSNYTISELTDDIKGKIKDNNTGTGKYSTLLELENALVNDDDYAAGENKYNIPQLKKYIDDNFYSQT
jgi:hypothetical protein